MTISSRPGILLTGQRGVKKKKQQQIQQKKTGVHLAGRESGELSSASRETLPDVACRERSLRSGELLPKMQLITVMQKPQGSRFM